VLELGGECGVIDTGPCKFGQQRFAIAVIWRQGGLHFAVPSEGEQRLLRNGVDSIRSAGVLGAGAGLQQALRSRAGVDQFLPTGRETSSSR